MHSLHFHLTGNCKLNAVFYFLGGSTGLLVMFIPCDKSFQKCFGQHPFVTSLSPALAPKSCIISTEMHVFALLSSSRARCRGVLWLARAFRPDAAFASFPRELGNTSNTLFHLLTCLLPLRQTLVLSPPSSSPHYTCCCKIARASWIVPYQYVTSISLDRIVIFKSYACGF